MEEKQAVFEANKIFPVSEEKIKFFHENGYVVIEDLIDPKELDYYREVYDKFLRGEYDSKYSYLRSDLGGHADRVKKEVENVTQIMWPSDIFPELRNCQYYTRARAVSIQLFSEPTMEKDFDMLIAKLPNTNTETPWHQDAAYWLNLPDKRAASCWLAMDETTLDNGCMWFVPGSHKYPVRKHWRAGTGSHQGQGALECECSEKEGVSVPIKPGSCTFHAGGTLHYSRGNKTGAQRRGFISNYRPKPMIDFEREQGFDHGRSDNTRIVRNEEAH